MKFMISKTFKANSNNDSSNNNSENDENSRFQFTTIAKKQLNF